MRTLAHDSCQVPPRYLVDPSALTVDRCLVAGGRFAVIRKGMLGDKTVAVRTLNPGSQTDPHDSVQKVCTAPNHFFESSQQTGYSFQRFCKESILWMSISHPHLLQLIAVDINPLTGECSMISEMMNHGNIKDYITKNSANRLQLVREPLSCTTSVQPTSCSVIRSCYGFRLPP